MFPVPLEMERLINVGDCEKLDPTLKGGKRTYLGELDGILVWHVLNGVFAQKIKVSVAVAWENVDLSLDEGR